MKPEKLERFPLFAKLSDSCTENEEKEPVNLKRIVGATERERVDNCDTALLEEVEESQHQEPTTGGALHPPFQLKKLKKSTLLNDRKTPGGDTAEYWQNIFHVLDNNTSEWDGDQFNGVCELPVAGEDDQIVFNGLDETIPAPDTTYLPRTNVRTFPQESRLLGIRGQKFSIQTLISSERHLG
ncbi:hypothetical protein L914_13178 [Phytophthora nicotianae]|uniref:Uncharacterized protein n=1 Tax=Phytophthora nicotianae TaxID=4792 RepID=W2MZY1_PHYNI|nr:hypothetical protein L914_13178 [Phytophthora nicotianae]